MTARPEFQSTGPLRDPTIPPNEWYNKTIISIHRSLAGPDMYHKYQQSCRSYFNPQVPCGTRLKPIQIRIVFNDFNPQVPCGTRRQHKEGNTMSKKFQSTGPLRDPTTDAYAGRSDRAISIHRSLAGPDRSGKPSDQPCGISIHRSLAGPDGGSAALDTNANDFNPQVPCGTRQGLGVEGCVDVQFQSTGPLRDPTRAWC